MIKRKELYRSQLCDRFLKLYHIVCEITFKGKTYNVSRDVIISKNSVAGIVIDSNNKRVLVIRQYREALYHYNNIPFLLLEAVAGFEDDGEDSHDTFIREVFEETGVVLVEDDIGDCFSYYPSPGNSSECTHICIAYVSDKTKIPEVLSGGLESEGEIIQPVWLDFDKIQDLWMANQIRDGKLLLALWEAGIIKRK